MSESSEYKTGSAQKAAKQRAEAAAAQKKRLDEITKQMRSSTVGGKD